jgi:competence protein ComGC
VEKEKVLGHKLIELLIDLLALERKLIVKVKSCVKGNNTLSEKGNGFKAVVALN